MTRRDNAKPTLARRALSCLISAAMVVAFTPAVAWGETATIPRGLIVSGEAGSFTYEGGIVTITSGGTFTIEGTGATTTDSIVVNSGVTADIALNSVSIQSSGCAFKVSDGASVNLTLVGANTLKSGGSNAGLYVGANQLTGEELVQGTLSIAASGDASLEATGGSGAAGIGGGSGEAAGRITISGGKITAIGGDGGSGISGDVCIAGGVVEATGGSNGAGIDGIFSTGEKGDAVVFASSIAENSFQSRASWSGVVCEGVCYEQSRLTISHEGPGPTVTICEDLTLDSGARMTIGSNATVVIGQGATLTNAGVIGIANAVETNEDGTVAVAQSGTLTNCGTIFSFGTIEGGITGSGPVVRATAPSATASQLVYNGEDQVLVTGGSISSNSTGSAQFQYRCVKNDKEAVATQTEGDGWSTSIPTAEAAGYYTVYYRLCYSKTDSDNSITTITSAEFSLDVTIKEPAITIEPASATVKHGETVELKISSTGLPQGATYTFSYTESPWSYPPNITGGDNGVFVLHMPQYSGKYILLVEYKGDENHEPASAECTITVEYDDVMSGVRHWGSSDGSGEETTVYVGKGQVGIALSEDSEQVEFKAISQEQLVSTLKPTVGSSSPLSSLDFDLSNLKSPVSHAKFTLSTFENISNVINDSSNSVESMKLKMSNGSVKLDKEAVFAIANQAGGDDVTINLEQKQVITLSPPQQKALKKFPALGACYEVSATSGNKEIHDLGAGAAEVRLQYEFPEGWDKEDLEAILIHTDDVGDIEYGDSTVLEIDGKQYLTTWRNHFSVYAIVYVQPTEATKAAVAALEALPQAGELKTAEAKAAVKAARAALKQVAALDEEQRAVVGKALVDNAEQVVERGTALIAKADEKAAKKVKSKSFSVKAGKGKSIAFKTTASAASTKVAYKKTSGSKYIAVTKSGKVTANKGMKKGKKYTAKVKVTCGATTRYVKVTVRAR